MEDTSCLQQPCLCQKQRSKGEQKVPDDWCAVSLGLPELEVLTQRSLEGGSLEVTVRYRTQTASCPGCGKPMAVVALVSLPAKYLFTLFCAFARML